MGRREAFDPLRTFVANRDFSWGGKPIAAGVEFTDRSNIRRLRQLYDSRHIRMSEVDNGAPLFQRMKEDELRQWLAHHGRGQLAHPRATHQRLVDRCRRLWVELQKQEGNDGIPVGVVRPEGSGEGIQEPAPPRRDTPERANKRERLG